MDKGKQEEIRCKEPMRRTQMFCPNGVGTENPVGTLLAPALGLRLPSLMMMDARMAALHAFSTSVDFHWPLNAASGLPASMNNVFVLTSGTLGFFAAPLCRAWVFFGTGDLEW
jgi:hypothetical protein